ncbi:MAG: phosphatidylglycerol lysyltransferase domain-containing protein [Ruminococcus sp.]|nr:phosphatidylglycerol lysyltransferase domain-containing protein [Ruminococcus sp.]
MFDFKEIRLDDKAWITKCLKTSDFRGCEYSFANNLAWRRLGNTLICQHDGFYISCSCADDGKIFFTFPSGARCDGEGIERYKKLFAELKDYAESKNSPLVISSVNSEHLNWMRDFYGDEITVSANRDYFDYIYKAEDLIALKGKKYHGKRNHIKRFKENNWSIEKLTPQLYDCCIEFATEFYNKNNGYDDYSAVVEQYVIHTFFANFEYLGLKGGVLRKNGEIVGFSVGEQLNSDTFVVHIEKARSDIQGAYPTICNEFLKAYATEFEYVNREEDLGLDGLRRSKLSYQPEFLLEKNTVTFK